MFGGGLDQNVRPESVSADGTVTRGEGAPVRQLDGGFTVLELPSIEEARYWAAKIAASCRCSQELHAFHYDPAS